MKKDSIMKKNSFVNGAIFVTICIIFTKILGVLYVIPFYSIIGEQGGALYGYAYSIYTFFISLSSAGIPLAISKIISEYNTIGNYDARDRTFYLGKKIAIIFGIISFLILNICAPFFASRILGDLVGGNSVSDVTLVIRVISSAILIVPILSIYRGYFQGYKYMEPPALSQIIEQIVRICVILIGSFLVLKIFKLSLSYTVGVAVFGATAGAIAGYFYLIFTKKNNRSKFINTKAKIKVPISDRMIIKKIFYYAFPLIMIDISKSIYNFIDTFSVVDGLVTHTGLLVSEAEAIVSMISTWATKFNMIVGSIATGIVVSLVPTLTEIIVKKDKEEMNKKINQALALCLFITIPLTFGISFLSRPIWTLFYGSSNLGSSLLGYFIFTGLFSSLFTVIVTIIELFKDYKVLFIGLLVGVLIKLFFNIPLVVAFYKEGMPGYYGIITATLLGYIISSAVCLLYLNIKWNINFEKLLTILFDILCGSVLMIFVLFVINLIIPITTDSRIISLLICILYGIVGASIYFIYTYKSKTIERLFGRGFIKKIKSLFIK